MFSVKQKSIILALLTVILVGLVFTHFQLNVSNREIPPNATASTGSVPAPEEPKIQNKEPFIVAILGTDQRTDEPARTDTIMLVRYDMENKKATIVSLPRDSYVKIPGKHKDKINAAHAYGGVDLTIETVEELLDINVDYYAKANFEGFKEAIETLGGVKVNAKKPIRYENIYIPAGEQTLKGDDLLMYVRFRKDADGDFGRINRQQEVILSIAKDLIKPSNLIKVPKLLSIASEHVDTNLNLRELGLLALDAKDFNNIAIEQHTLKTHSKKMNGVWYELVDEEDVENKSMLLQGLSPSSTSEFGDTETNEEVFETETEDSSTY